MMMMIYSEIFKFTSILIHTYIAKQIFNYHDCSACTLYTQIIGILCVTMMIGAYIEKKCCHSLTIRTFVDCLIRKFPLFELYAVCVLLSLSFSRNRPLFHTPAHSLLTIKINRLSWFVIKMPFNITVCVCVWVCVFA